MDALPAMPPLDSEGYLVEPGAWTEAVAAELARRINIDLTDDHWFVIRFMREYYAEHQVSADARHVIRHLEQRYPGTARKQFFVLFPYGHPAQACKVAGMKRPRAWSTG
jgi:tRNA 2-thiouridine synthesizing protein E